MTTIGIRNRVSAIAIGRKGRPSKEKTRLRAQ